MQERRFESLPEKGLLWSMGIPTVRIWTLPTQLRLHPAMNVSGSRHHERLPPLQAVLPEPAHNVATGFLPSSFVATSLKLRLCLRIQHLYHDSFADILSNTALLYYARVSNSLLSTRSNSISRNVHEIYTRKWATPTPILLQLLLRISGVVCMGQTACIYTNWCRRSLF